MLPPRRSARGHRCQRHGRQADPRFLSQDFRTAAGPGARRRRRAPGLRSAREGGRRQVARGDRRRLHQDRGREHGERDQEDLRAARLRRDPLRAQLLRRRRRPARLPGRRRARHDQGADPSVLVAAVGLRHGARRHPCHAPAGDRGDLGSGRAGVDCIDRRQARRRCPARGGRPGRTGARHHRACAGAHPLRRDGYRAGRACARSRARVEGGLRSGRSLARRHEVGVRGRAQIALRFRRREQGAGGRGGLGRGGRRRGEVLRAHGRDDDGAPSRSCAHDPLLFRRRLARGRGLPARCARAGPQGQRPRRHRRAAPDRRGRGWLDREADRQGPSRPHPQQGAGAAGGDRHQGRSGHARDLQQPVHVDRRADGRVAAEHRLFRQHQGAARLLLRGVRRRRHLGRQCAAHAGASRLHGPRGRDHHPREQGHGRARRRLRHQCALQRRHASPRHHDLHAGV